MYNLESDLQRIKIELSDLYRQKDEIDKQIEMRKVAINTMEQIKKLSEDVPRGTE